MSAPPLALPSDFAYLSGDGWVRAQLVLTPLGQQNDLIRAAANSIPVDLFNVAISHLKQPIHLRVSGPTITSYTQLPVLNFETVWTLYDKGTKLHPCWTVLHATTCSTRSLTWKPPQNMGVFYVSQYSGGNWMASYLVAIRTGVEKYYRLPTGNVNSAGQICMGNKFKSDPLRPLLERIVGEVETFMKTAWNSDLLSTDDSRHAAMFSFLADGSAQVPVPLEWERHCLVMNTSVYNGLPFNKIVKL